MTDYIEIRCQQKECPYGKKHCCFGEISVESIGSNIIVERHVCKLAKKEHGDEKYVTVVIVPHNAA